MTPRRPSRSSRRRPPIQATPVLEFHPFIVYADTMAARQAMHTIDEVLRATRRPFELRPMLWRFDQFEQPKWSEHALCDAARADIVVVASSNSETLPASLERWIGGLIARLRGKRLDLVAIMGDHDTWTISIETPVAASSAPTALATATARAA